MIGRFAGLPLRLEPLTPRPVRVDPELVLRFLLLALPADFFLVVRELVGPAVERPSDDERFEDERFDDVPFDEVPIDDVRLDDVRLDDVRLDDVRFLAPPAAVRLEPERLEPERFGPDPLGLDPLGPDRFGPERADDDFFRLGMGIRIADDDALSYEGLVALMFAKLCRGRQCSFSLGPNWSCKHSTIQGHSLGIFPGSWVRSAMLIVSQWSLDQVLGRVPYVRQAAGLLLLATCAVCGCASPNSSAPPPLASDYASQRNPAIVSAVDQEFLWSQIHDELDDYFKVRREERVRVVRNTLTPGWVETFPTTGASILEPWRKDAASSYERWLGTFQSIRRWARVSVVPLGNEFQIEVQVYKELEDLDRPSEANAGGLTLRHDNSPEAEQDPNWYEPDQYGWIPMGRDAALEQRILRNIVARVTIP